jgi:hypothetical protein
MPVSGETLWEGPDSIFVDAIGLASGLVFDTPHAVVCVRHGQSGLEFFIEDPVALTRISANCSTLEVVSKDESPETQTLYLSGEQVVQVQYACIGLRERIRTLLRRRVYPGRPH